MYGRVSHFGRVAAKEVEIVIGHTWELLAACTKSGYIQDVVVEIAQRASMADANHGRSP